VRLLTTLGAKIDFLNQTIRARYIISESTWRNNLLSDYEHLRWTLILEFLSLTVFWYISYIYIESQGDIS
jgi:hypothetical protein